MYNIIPVPDEAADQAEQLGTKPKFWFWNEHDEYCLFKIGRPGTGENWTEKVSAEICKLLRIPHAEYELATWRGSQGVVSRKFAPDNARLEVGNELLGRFVPGYHADMRYYEQSGHTVTRVIALLRWRRIKPALDPNFAQEWNTAADMFVGYLMLDAAIGNTDRHDENWGVLNLQSGKTDDICLAPTFDHASSLGRNEPDHKRQARLTTKDKQFSVVKYAERARSAFYRTPTDAKPLSTFDAFKEAARLQPKAAKTWLSRLVQMKSADVQAIFQDVPPEFITPLAREFAEKILEVNCQRLGSFLEEIP